MPRSLSLPTIVILIVSCMLVAPAEARRRGRCRGRCYESVRCCQTVQCLAATPYNIVAVCDTNQHYNLIVIGTIKVDAGTTLLSDGVAMIYNNGTTMCGSDPP